MSSSPSRKLILAACFSSFAVSPSAAADIYLNGSVAQASSNAGLLTHSTNSGSAGVDVSLGTYVRVGLSHAQQFSVSEGYVQRDGTLDADPNDPRIYDLYTSKTHAWANSVDFTFILYEGEIVVPYLKAGLVWKTYFVESNQAGEITKDGYRNLGPWENLGAGLGFKLNRQFTLKFFYGLSPGQQFIPTPAGIQAKKIMDKKTTVGITYQL